MLNLFKFNLTKAFGNGFIRKFFIYYTQNGGIKAGGYHHFMLSKFKIIITSLNLIQTKQMRYVICSPCQCACDELKFNTMQPLLKELWDSKGPNPRNLLLILAFLSQIFWVRPTSYKRHQIISKKSKISTIRLILKGIWTFENELCLDSKLFISLQKIGQILYLTYGFCNAW